MKSVRMTKRRATIARRLVEAQHTAAMLTTFNEVDMSVVMALRDRHKQAFKESAGSVSDRVLFVKASIAALREFPRLNAEVQGDEMVLKRYYDIGVAVGAGRAGRARCATRTASHFRSSNWVFASSPGRPATAR
jgi:2-oxoglutarate dehydrogenase E2 component (dihydrolipoamide succinyltransferase)